MKKLIYPAILFTLAGCGGAGESGGGLLDTAIGGVPPRTILQAA